MNISNFSDTVEPENATKRIPNPEIPQGLFKSPLKDSSSQQAALRPAVRSRKEIAASASPEAITPAKKRNKPTGRSTRLSESPREFKMEKKEKTEKMTSSPVVAGRGAAARSTRVRGAPNDSLFHVK